MAVAAGWIMLSSHAGCTPAAKRDPEQSQIRFQLAADYFRNRRVEPALDELQKSLQLDPQNADAYNLMGLVLLQQGAQYVDQLEVSACLKGADGEAVRREATQKFREAEQSFQHAVKHRPEFPGAWNNLAVAALQLQEWDVAVEAARSALKDITYGEPEMARANLGWAYLQKKELHDAWKELHEAAARSPGFCLGHYRLAKLYMERGDIELAAEEADAVIGQKECPIQEAYLLAGLVHERRKERERAKELFARCVDLAPRSCLAAECRGYGRMIQ